MTSLSYDVGSAYAAPVLSQQLVDRKCLAQPQRGREVLVKPVEVRGVRVYT
jgi:hypothetical protein